MSFMEKFTRSADRETGRDGLREAGTALNPEMDEALRDFRLSVHAWSEAQYSRSRAVFVASPRRVAWRLAAGWALGCVLVTCGVSAGIYVHRQQEMKMAAVRAAEHERLATKQRNLQVQQEDEDLLAKVDRDVSREVPSALEPLARLMAEDDAQ